MKRVEIISASASVREFAWLAFHGIKSLFLSFSKNKVFQFISRKQHPNFCTKMQLLFLMIPQPHLLNLVKLLKYDGLLFSWLWLTLCHSKEDLEGEKFRTNKAVNVSFSKGVNLSPRFSCEIELWNPLYCWSRHSDKG